MEWIVALGGLGGLAGILSFVQFLITRNDNRNSKNSDIAKKLERIDERQKKSEMDSIRTQMLVLISDYPEETSEILKLSEYYFEVLGGDWYMTDIFTKWMKAYNVSKPLWLRS